MMNNRWLFFVLFALIEPTLLSCEDCGPTDEPSLYLGIESSAPFRIDTLYGVGATGQSVAQTLRANSALKTSQKSAYFILPINLTADSTRYTILIDNHLETITVFYQRDFRFRNQHCGYVINLYAPLGQRARTSRGQISGVTYTQNSYDARFLHAASSETGIQAILSL